MRSLLCREGVIGPEPAVPSDQDARDSVQPARGPDATAASPLAGEVRARMVFISCRSSPLLPTLLRRVPT